MVVNTIPKEIKFSANLKPVVDSLSFFQFLIESFFKCILNYY